MTPIPPSSVLFMLQSGYSAEHIMPIMLDPINGLNNEANRLRRPADPKFTRPCRAVAGRSACRRHPDSHRTSQGWCRELRADFWTEQGPTDRSKRHRNKKHPRVKAGPAGTQSKL